MKKNDWPYKPNTIQIELVQGCNRRCNFCGTMGIERKFHYADIETVRHTCRLIREAGLNCRILLAGHGEPTMHPHVSEIVREIRRILPGNMIHMFSNGTILAKRPGMVTELFNAGLNDLIFDEYRDSPIGNFVIGSKECTAYPIVRQGPGVPLYAEKDVSKKRICIVPPIDGDRNTASRKLNNHCGAGGRQLKTSMKCRCSIAFRDFFVRWDGNIAICCNDFRGEYYVCNINDCKTLREAYFHPRLEAARRYLILGDRQAVHPCDVCNARAIRPGLLPDVRAKVKLPLPSAEDRQIVKEKHEPLAKVVPRDWEARR